MTEPPEDEAPLERPAREVVRGRSERTPFLIVGGMAGMIWLVAAVVAAILLLLWWAL